MISSILNNLFAGTKRSSAQSTRDDQEQEQACKPAKETQVRPQTPHPRASIYFRKTMKDGDDSPGSDDAAAPGGHSGSLTPPPPPKRRAQQTRFNSENDGGWQNHHKKRTTMDIEELDGEAVMSAAPMASKKPKSIQTGLEDDAAEPTSMHPEPLLPSSSSASVANETMMTIAPPERDASAPSPPSPECFDEVQMKSRTARAFALARPEDYTSASPQERRLKEFRTASSTQWMRAVNNATIERDYKRVRELLTSPEEQVKIRNDAQFEKLLRCSVVLRDWRTISILLFYANRHLNNEREIVDATRDLIALGVQTSSSEVASQQICLHLLMNSFEKLPRHSPRAVHRQFSVADLVGFCRNDNVVSLAVGYLQFADTGRVISGPQFCDLETAIQVSPSTAVHETPDDPDEDRKREETIATSYFTPKRPYRGGETSEDEEEDEQVVNHYAHVVIPSALNKRKASLIEFAGMISAPHCLMFLCELAAGRLL